MKRIFKFIPAALAVVALSSCSNDDLFGSAEGNLSQKNTLKVTVQQINDGDITRAANLGDGNGMVWQDGDQITVYDDKLFIYDPYKYNATAKAFVLDEDEKEMIDKPAYALFPTAYFAEDESTNWERATDRVWVRANIRSHLKYGAASDGSWSSESTPYVTSNGKTAYVSLLPMWGTASKNGESTEATMQYMTAIIKVTLTNAQDNVKYLYVRGFKDIAGTQPAQLNGFFKAYLSETGRTPLASTTLAPLYDNPTIQDNYIEVDISNIDKATSVIYVPVPVGHYGKLQVWATDTQIPVSETSTPGNATINAADKIHEFVDKDFEVKFYGSLTKKVYNVEVGTVAAINKLLNANKDEAKDNLVLNGANGSATAATAEDYKIALPQMAAGTVELKLKGITGHDVTINGDDFSKKFILNLTSTAQNITINLPNADVVLVGNYNSKNVTIENAKTLTFGDGTAPTSGEEPTTKGFGTITINAEVQGNIVVEQFAQVGKLTLPANHRATGISVNEKGEAGDITVLASELPSATATNITVAGTSGFINTTAVDNAATNVNVSGKSGYIYLKGSKNTGNVVVSGICTAEIRTLGTGSLTLSGVAGKITWNDNANAGDITISGAPNYKTVAALGITAGGSDYAKVGTVNTKGNVTINLDGEGAAIGTSVTFNKTANLNLTQGYIKSVVVESETATDVVTITNGADAAYTLIGGTTATSGKFKISNGSKWNGKLVGEGIPADATNKAAATTAYKEYADKNFIATATTFAELISGKTVNGIHKIYADIDLNSQEFNPSTGLNGNVIGQNGYKKGTPVISGIKLKELAKNNDAGYGLFKKTSGATGQINNLTFNGITITTAADGGCANIGALVGLVNQEFSMSGVTVEGVNIQAKKLSYNIGGVVGSVAATGEVVMTDVTVNAPKIEGYKALGGLIGYVTNGGKVTLVKGGTAAAPTYCVAKDAVFTQAVNSAMSNTDPHLSMVGSLIGSTDNETAANIVINVADAKKPTYTVSNESTIAPLRKWSVPDGVGTKMVDIVKLPILGLTGAIDLVKGDCETADKYSVNISIAGAAAASYTNKGKLTDAPASTVKYLDYFKNY